MPRLILKCPYLKGGGATAEHRKNYVRYIATREGAQEIDPGKEDWPATKKQRQMANRLLRDFPECRELFEYQDYQAAPTRANASEFITRALEDNMDGIAKREDYLKYIALRPRAEKMGAHALFTGTDEPLELKQVAQAIAENPGNVWLPILSLRREDAARLGYDSAQSWRSLLSSRAPDIAKAMKIPWEQFRWYAAFHDEGHHPHVHMMVYSADGRSGYLTKDGIAAIKSVLAKDIFRQELTEIYQAQTVRRDELVAQARERMEQLIQEMGTGTLENPRIEQLTAHLARRLQTTKGKKQYGYLKPQLKAVVDEVVDELARDPRVAAAYDLWYELREEVLRTYRDELPERLPLSQQKEFKQIKNMVIQEAVRLGNVELRDVEPGEQEIPDPLFQDGPAAESASQEDEAPDGDSPQEMEPSVTWSPEYKLARASLYGTEGQPPDVSLAYDLFLREAERGNALAMCDLGRMQTDGIGRDPDPEEGCRWYAKALSAFLTVEGHTPDRYTEYRIGKLYAWGLGTDQDCAEAAKWFAKAAEQGYKYAQYSLAGLYLRGQGVERDEEEAHRLYAASALQGVPHAAFELAKLLRDGRGCEKNPDASAEWFANAYQGFVSLERQSHDDRLQYRLGWMLLHGVGVPQDKTAAREWLEKSARLSNQNAQYQLARLILTDENAGTEEIEQAVAWLTESAKAGQDCAQYTLGELYRDGRGVEKDVLQAVIWFSRAAEQDNSYAAYALGKLYLTGEDAPKDMDAALRWLRRSAELGNQYAQYRLGKLYLSGEGIPKDAGRAVEYLTASAEQGNQFAQCALGKLYLQGADVVKDTAKAMEYLTAAAQQGSQYAQYALGKLYLLGREVERDEDAAVHWFTLAAGQGNEYAQWFLDHMNEFRGPTPFQCATRLLHHMSRIFQDETPRLPAGMRIEVDSKLRRRIREKKIAMGHKPDDHEQRM